MLGGGDTGPKVLDSDEEVKKFVASDEGEIAFSMRLIYTIH